MHGRILIVDDDRGMCELLETDLRLRGFDVVWRTSAAEAFDVLRVQNFDSVLTDLRMPGTSGIELCERILGDRPDVPVVVLTAFGSLETAVEALRAGAYDFITKPVELDVLAHTMRRAVEHHGLREKVRVLSEAVERSRSDRYLSGASAAMERLRDEIDRVADSEATVLVTGESGTGKELVVRALHAQSRRASAPLVTVNCAALPDALLESELFGHTRGAFTDARTAREGLFVRAHGGTLFLDEVGELPLALQPKLLRVLEEGLVRPIGSDQEHPVDVRIVAATHRDLESAVEDGHFREDLYFRVNVIRLEVPPLRSRAADVLQLAQQFVEQFGRRTGKGVRGISEPAIKKLVGYCWPGNVRELRNAMERAVAWTRHDRLTVDDLPEKIRGHRASRLELGGNDPNEFSPLEEVERRYVLHVLSAVGGHKTQAARILGLDRTTLYRKLQRYGKLDGEP